ncbi:MAG: transposase [Methylicorpusculum sp.]|uniref:transposase n=1 Tax=Methylicorpusculum sp. TaxID=2713644 RepID=UPI00273111FC|nr:transposase [Methylicorpusculum sp.]MDP2201037.1 transposase [Methylicorpusculum sp.]
MIALDEFALQSIPDTHYAWAQKNTKPRVLSDERHRQKMNGFLMVDVQRGDTWVEFHEDSRSEQVAGVPVTLLLSYLQQGYRQVTVLLDNARTHGKRMQDEVSRLLQELSSPSAFKDFTVNYRHTPTYSPQLNPAEYVIHAIRRNALYHVPCTLSLANKVERVGAQLARGSPMNDVQMRSLLDYIARYKVKRF